MEEVSISEIEKQADTLEENDLLLISQYKNDGSFDSAKIEGKNLKQKLPGLMVRMWNCHDAQLELPFSGREVINNLTYKTESFEWYQSRSGSILPVNCETAIGPLVTNGCSMLYKRLESKDRYFHDEYNNSDFWFYAGSFDSPAIYKYFAESNVTRPGTSVQDYYKCEVTTDTLQHSSLNYITLSINDYKVDVLSNFILNTINNSITFDYEITNPEHPDYDYFHGKVLTYTVNFDQFNKPSEPVTPAIPINASDVPDEKVCVYEGRIKLAKGKTVKFKGHVDNFASIFINGTQLCDFVGYNEQEIDVEFTSRDDKLYYDFKLLIVNYGTNGPGFENDFPQYSDLRMSLDNGTTWINISNESFDPKDQFFFLPNNCDDYYRQAQELRDRGTAHKPGLLIKMWHTGYEVGRKSASCNFDHDVVDSVEARDYKISKAINDSGVYYDATTYQEIDATDGCELLYTRQANKYTPKFFDWFNGKEWDYYTGGGDPTGATGPIQYDQDPRDKKIVAYFGEIYLPKNQVIYFKGRVDDSLSIMIDDIYPVSDDDEMIPLKGMHYSNENAGRIFKFESTYTGYHKFKLVACNCATTSGPRPEVTSPEYTVTIKFSFDQTNWYRLSNQGAGRNIFFVPAGDRYDEIYQKAINDRDNIRQKRLPGMLVKMWQAQLPKDACSINCFLPEIIDFCPPGIGSIIGALEYNGVKYDASIFKDLNVTQGCGILYKKCSIIENDRNYYDPFNAVKWDFSCNHYDENTKNQNKLLIYYTQFYMHAGQEVCFKGIPDDTISILINNQYIKTSANMECKYITSFVPAANATDCPPSTIFRYKALIDGYQNLRIVVTNKTDHGGLDERNSGLLISFDNGVNWKQVTNEAYENPIFFIPEGIEYRKLWFNAEKAREVNNHYIDFNDPARITHVSEGNNHYWTANDNGTFIVSIDAYTSTQTNLVDVYVTMPGTENWVQIAQYTPHHSRYQSDSFTYVNLCLPLRVVRGTRIKVTNVKTIIQDNTKLFRDVNFDYEACYKPNNVFTVTFLNGYNDGVIYKDAHVTKGTLISEIKPSNPTRSATAQYTYSFSNWSVADDVPVVSDTTVNAQWTSTVNNYTIRFVNNGGTLLRTDSVAYGTTPSYPGIPEAEQQKSGYLYSFTGWSPALTSVTGNRTYTATYSESMGYIVRFFQHSKSSTPFAAVRVARGSKVTPPSDSEGVLTGWTRDAWYSQNGVSIDDPIYQNTDFYAIYSSTSKVSTELPSTSGGSVKVNITDGRILPVGLDINAGVSGKITHGASPNHTMQMNAYIGPSSFSTSKCTNISEWPETITATGSSTFTVNEGACCVQTISSNDTTLWFYAKKTDNCTVKWTLNLTVTLQLM